MLFLRKIHVIGMESKLQKEIYVQIITFKNYNHYSLNHNDFSNELKWK